MKLLVMFVGVMLAVNGFCGPVYTELDGIDVHEEMSQVRTFPTDDITAKVVNLKSDGKEYKGNIVFNYKHISTVKGNPLLAITFSAPRGKDIQGKMFLKWYLNNSLRQDREQQPYWFLSRIT